MFYYNPATKTSTYLPMSHSHTTQHTSTSTGSCQDDGGCNTCTGVGVIAGIILFTIVSIAIGVAINEYLLDY